MMDIETVDTFVSRSFGNKISPANILKLRAKISDTSEAYQRMTWDALEKSIRDYISEVNVDNIGVISRELMKENLVRGRGVLWQSIMQAQAASPTLTPVYASLVAIINSRMPYIVELLIRRLVIQFVHALQQNDNTACLSACRFLVHLIHQKVVHEILSLDMLVLLIDVGTNDSVEVAITLFNECGKKMEDISSKGVNGVFGILKHMIRQEKLDKRIEYMLEAIFQVRKEGFKDYTVMEELQLVKEPGQFIHMTALRLNHDPQDVLG